MENLLGVPVRKKLEIEFHQKLQQKSQDEDPDT